MTRAHPTRGRAVRLFALTGVLAVTAASCASDNSHAAIQPTVNPAIGTVATAATAAFNAPRPRSALSTTRTQHTAASTLTSGRFGTRPSERVLLLVASTTTNSNPGLSVAAVCGLRWKLIATRRHGSEVARAWTATATLRNSGCVVTVRPHDGLAAGTVSVLGFLNGGSIGARHVDGGAPLAPHVTLRPRFSQSTVYAVGVEPVTSVRPQAASGSRILHRSASSDAKYWVERSAAPTLARSRITLGLRRPAAGAWDTVAVEVTPRANCFHHLAACGYPDRADTGVPAGRKLKAVNGNVIVTKPNTVIDNERITGYVAIEASNVTIENTEVIVSLATDDESTAPFGIEIGLGSTGDVIKDSSVHGSDSGVNAVEYGIWNPGDTNSTSVFDHDQVYNCTECLYGGGTWENTYAIANGNPGPLAHIEATYYQGGKAFVTYKHDTLLTPPTRPTAAVYATSDSGLVTHMTVTDCMLAGGAYTIYAGNSTATDVSINNNRISRAYEKLGGVYGVVAYYPASMVWTGNIWDNSRRNIRR